MNNKRWIVIRNWDRFQHYNDRWVPWIKTYTELLHDEAYLRLPAGTRSVLHGLWLVYVSSRCRVPLDTRWITRQLNLRCTKTQVTSLVRAGFIEISSRPNLDHVKMASRPTRTRKEVEKEVDRTPPPPFEKGGEDLRSQNGQVTLFKRELSRYTGCRVTKGTHGPGWKNDPLGTDKPPPDWPHDRPTRQEVEAALAAER